MTDVGSPIDLTQQAAGNEPVEIQKLGLTVDKTWRPSEIELMK